MAICIFFFKSLLLALGMDEDLYAFNERHPVPSTGIPPTREESATLRHMLRVVAEPASSAHSPAELEIIRSRIFRWSYILWVHQDGVLLLDNIPPNIPEGEPIGFEPRVFFPDYFSCTAHAIYYSRRLFGQMLEYVSIRTFCYWLGYEGSHTEQFENLYLG